MRGRGNATMVWCCGELVSLDVGYAELVLIGGKGPASREIGGVE